MYFRRAALAALVVLVAAGSVQADQTRSQEIAALKQAKQKLARLSMSNNGRGGTDPRFLRDRNQLNGLIADLESGKKVDPAAVDRALSTANDPCH